MKEEDVQKQLSQMVNFIMKEAREKADEIGVKAEEEFNIEKQRMVQTEKQKVQKEFERQEKQIEIQKKIAFSNELNQSRLKILKAREDAVNKIVEDAFNRLEGVAQKGDYKDLLLDLTVQALIKLKEPEAFLICREVDLSLVKSLISHAEKNYKEKTGLTVKLSIDNVNKLNPPRDPRNPELPSCTGGIMVSTAEGRILCNNTLEQRLSLAYEQLLPYIRVKLVGNSPNRVHFSRSSCQATTKYK